ncbi:hypothetical protein EVAR_45378_1 [Eumeta japonica]|uniref:Uncharacterized protein n=1 Tax=Eumeta variegata TaxID=151549 RepID=A0A4C1WTR9_EUMVA|nr:hypothetical protein EVAR_45378_1 [Eumeta japonica]
MDQELAKRLLIEGGTFVFLGVPGKLSSALMHCWNTAEDFRGVKMIPEEQHSLTKWWKLFSMIGELKQKLTEKFQWDFTGLDSEDEEEKPLHRVRPDGMRVPTARDIAMDDAWWKSSRHRMSQETVTGRFPSLLRPEAVSGGRVE